MSKMRCECGSCDYSIDLNEKLQSHYMAVHGLSHKDASKLVYQKEFLIEDVLEIAERHQDEAGNVNYASFVGEVNAL
jgi:hypothetical protein